MIFPNGDGLQVRGAFDSPERASSANAFAGEPHAGQPPVCICVLKHPPHTQQAAGSLGLVCAKGKREFFRRGVSGPPRTNVKKFLNTLLGLQVDLQVLTHPTPSLLSLAPYTPPQTHPWGVRKIMVKIS